MRTPWQRTALRVRLALALAATAVLFLVCAGVAVYYLDDAKAKVGLRNLLLTLAGAVAFSIPLGIYLWRAATRPLRRLREVLGRAELDLPAGVEIAPRDEVAELLRPLAALLERERKLTALRQEKIAVLRDRMHVLVHSIGEGVIVLDEAGVIVELNDAARGLGGSGLTEGSPLSSPSIPEPLREALIGGLRGETERSPFRIVLDGPGGTVPVTCLTRRVRNSAGELRGCVVILSAQAS